MERYSDLQIAASTTAVITGLREVQLDPGTAAVWAATHPQLRLVALKGVKRVRANPGITAAEHHEAWVWDMAELGWTVGRERDLDRRTHPNMVQFGLLSPQQQQKDEGGLLWIRFLAGLEWPS